MRRGVCAPTAFKGGPTIRLPRMRRLFRLLELLDGLVYSVTKPSGCAKKVAIIPVDGRSGQMLLSFRLFLSVLPITIVAQSPEAPTRSLNRIWI